MVSEVQKKKNFNKDSSSFNLYSEDYMQCYFTFDLLHFCTWKHLNMLKICSFLHCRKENSRNSNALLFTLAISSLDISIASHFI